MWSCPCVLGSVTPSEQACSKNTAASTVTAQGTQQKGPAVSWHFQWCFLLTGRGSPATPTLHRARVLQVLPNPIGCGFGLCQSSCCMRQSGSRGRRRSSLKTLPAIFHFVWRGFVFHEPQTSSAASVCVWCLTSPGGGRGGWGGGHRPPKPSSLPGAPSRPSPPARCTLG